MNLYVETLSKRIQTQIGAIEPGRGRLQFTVPSISGADAVELLSDCKDLALESRRELVFKIADECRFAPDWTAADRAALAEYFADGNLTAYRNDIRENTFVVLLGTALAADSGSLSDFYGCGAESLFSETMGGSFSGWVKVFLVQSGIVPEAEWRAAWDGVLGALMDETSLRAVSRILGEVPTEEGAEGEAEKFQAVLRHLGPSLPNLSGFVEHARNPGRKTFRYYMGQARGVFSYGAFLEDTGRQRALSAIADFRDSDVRPDVDPAPFASLDDLLEALERYVKNHDTTDIETLRKVDFVMVLDKILGFRPPRATSASSDRNPLKKMSGAPLEVILRGIWLTLGEFAKNVGNEICPSRITLEGVLYRHDQPDDDSCLEYLKRILGGLDAILTTHLTLRFGEGDEVEIESNLLSEDLHPKRAGASVPFYEFHVTVFGEGNVSAKRRFAILLPDIHPSRLAEALISCAQEAIDDIDLPGVLPVFHLPYYRELFLSREVEESARVLDVAVKKVGESEPFLTNLFTSDWRDVASASPLRPFIDNLSRQFRNFLHAAQDNGFPAAVWPSGGSLFVKAYADAVHAYSGENAVAARAHKAAAMLMRAYLFVARRGSDDAAWKTANHESSAIATVLHPALLEMIQARWEFLTHAFAFAASAEFASNNGARFVEKRWTCYESLAEMKYPLVGLPVAQNGAFQLVGSGDGFLFKVGNLSLGSEMAANCFLTRYDAGFDDGEEYSEQVMFKESSESRLLDRTLRDFLKMHKSARDGLSVAVYRNEDVQAVLAGVHSFLKFLESKDGIPLNERIEKYAFRLMVFSEATDTSAVSQLLAAWQEYIESEDEEEAPYKGCRISVAHRFVSPGEGGCEELADIIRKEVDADIFVLYDFIRPDSKGCRFAEVPPPAADELGREKFPVVEQAQCASTDPDDIYHRSLIMSNRQFVIASGHVNLSRRIVDNAVRQDLHNIVLADGNFSPWRCVVDAAHEAAEWIVAIDPLVDRMLIGQDCDEQRRPKRELIGFGSGVGKHGESNFTISTQRYRIHELYERLLRVMRGVFPYGSPERDRTIAKRLLDEARELSGLSIIRAVGPGEYVRDFLAYGLMHRILPVGRSRYCDRLFSIDAYRHWFEFSADERRPDLLWLSADIGEDGRFHLAARLIECKMGGMQFMPGYLEKAFQQIENGLRVLMPLFAPLASGATCGRPDSRYWYLQLHRMIASATTNIQGEELPVFLHAMERLAAGDFEIEWGAAVYSFITDDCGDAAMHKVDTREVQAGAAATFTVNAYQAAYGFIAKICSEETFESGRWDEEMVTGVERAEMPVFVYREDYRQEENDELDQTMETDDSRDGLTGEPAPEEHGTNVIGNRADDGGDVMSREGGDSSVAPVDSQLTGSGREEHAEERSVPARVFLGKTRAGKEVYWEFGHAQLTNRHFLIFGNSGTGKTYAIQAILAELARHGQNGLIVDYTNGFINQQLRPEFLSGVKPYQHVLKRSGVPISPFKKASADDGCGGRLEETEIDVATRVTSIFDSVYNLGDQQKSVLVDAIQAGIMADPDFGMSNLIPALEDMLGDDIHPQTSLRSVISKLRPFVAANLFRDDSPTSWDDIFSNPEYRCQVFQMTMLDRMTYLLLTEFILWDLYATARTSWRESMPHVVVLDEVQNLDQRLDSPLGKFLTEGRKFGLCLVAATQTLSNLRDDEKARLFQAAHKLFFKPADSELRRYSELVKTAARSGSVDDWKAKLSSLSRGECISIGPSEEGTVLRDKVNIVKISTFEERGL